MIQITELEKKIKDIENKLLDKKKTSNTISMLRLVVALLTIVFIFKSFKGGINLIEGSIIGLGIAIFIALVVAHIKVKSAEKYLNSKISIINEYILRLTGKWNEIEDNGEEEIDSDHFYTGDLDIFGKGSLFQLINTTKTFKGRRLLIDTLKGNSNLDNLELKQKAVKEISENLEFDIEIQTLGKVNISQSKDPKQLIDYAEEKSVSYNSKLLKYIVYIIPVVLVVSSVLAYVTLSKIFLNIALVSIIINIVFNGYFIVKGYEGFAKVDPFKKDIKAYANTIRLIEETKFSEEYLLAIQSKLKKDITASNVIKKLESIVNNIDLRYNAMAYFILNIVFLWDYQCMFSLEDFKRKYGMNIREYLKAVGEVEELVSLGVIGQVNANSTFPNISKEEKVFINTKGLGHPLINGETRINNDISIDENILVITGSNMSGKTTFLRTLGINLVLAYSGAEVVAEEFSSCKMRILTSMRITDNLEMGISTFYAELIRIRNIIEASKNNSPMIFLIDEIFRGTNSQDRIVGAKNVIRSLSKKGIIGCISTHDFELCDVSDERVRNFHFEEHYSGGKILFDYKIKSGKCTTKNAKYLMKLVGIQIEE